MMDIGIVVVTYNRLDKLKQSLRCYAQQTQKPTYIIVVNNCSTDGTEDFLNIWRSTKDEFKKYVINLSENQGGAGGFYWGMKKACELPAEWIWLADDDAYPRTNALEKLSAYYNSINAKDQQAITALCSAVYNKGEIHCGHRNYVSVTRFKVIIKKSELNDYDKKAFEFNMLSYVGACIRKSVLQQVGLDEKDYFIYRDDQEHSFRLNKVGKLICVTDSIVDHDSPPFDENVIDWGKFYFKRNDLLMIRKNFPLRYFAFRYLKRYMADASVFSKKDPMLKKMYRAAYKDALFNKKGIHEVYKPGWKYES